MKTKQDLVDALIKQFINDANAGDTSILDELLMKFVSVQNLLPCLDNDEHLEEFSNVPEINWKEYTINSIRTLIYNNIMVLDREDYIQVYADPVIFKGIGIIAYDGVSIEEFEYDNYLNTVKKNYQDLDLEVLTSIHIFLLVKNSK